jgi:diketogulonate reductase-like aldo/keto reductase
MAGRMADLAGRLFEFAAKERRMQVVEGHGARIPALGFGTMTLKENVCVEMVQAALHLGYRHLDTAQNYGNEREVGEGLRASGVRREDVFLTTKVWFNRLAPGDLERSAEESLEKLKLPWVDLLLVHWPNAQIPLADSIGSLCKVKQAGLAKHIGVANFTVAMLDEAVAHASEPLASLQIEVHPFLDQTKILAAARRHGLAVVAYCPLARGKVPGDEVLARIGRVRGKTASQVALRWLEQQGVVPIPRTSKRERLAENLASLEFTLSGAEMAEIDTLKRPGARIVSPPQAPQWDS